jgi:hypothetical protein
MDFKVKTTLGNKNENENENQGTPPTVKENQGTPLTVNENQGTPLTVKENKNENQGTPPKVNENERENENQGTPPKVNENERENENQGTPLTVNENERENQGTPPTVKENQGTPLTVNENERENQGTLLTVNENERENENQGTPPKVNENERENQGTLLTVNENERENENQGTPPKVNENERENENQGTPPTVKENERENENQGTPLSVKENEREKERENNDGMGNERVDEGGVGNIRGNISCEGGSNGDIEMKQKEGRERKYFSYFSDEVEKIRESKFVIMEKIGRGWEHPKSASIFSEGVLPLFPESEEEFPEKSMQFFPKKISSFLRKEMGVHKKWIDFDRYSEEKYKELSRCFSVYCKEKLSTKKIAEYILEIAGVEINREKCRSVLFYSLYENENEVAGKNEEYRKKIEFSLVHGFGELLGGDKIVEYPKRKHDCDRENNDCEERMKIDRIKIEREIKIGEFDLIFLMGDIEHLGKKAGTMRFPGSYKKNQVFFIQTYCNDKIPMGSRKYINRLEKINEKGLFFSQEL